MFVATFLLGAVAVAVLSHPLWGKKGERGITDVAPPTNPHTMFKYKHILARAKGYYDIVVIGSGIGGLLLAALLARLQNKKVLVLEQHTEVGGCMHRFSLPGNPDHEFESGVRFIGGLDPDMKVLLAAAAPNATWKPVPGTCYDQVAVNGKITTRLYRGRRKWIGAVLSKARGREERQQALLAVREVEKAANASRVAALLKVMPCCISRVAWRVMRLAEDVMGWRLAPYYSTHTFNQVVAGAPDACRRVMTAQSGNLGTEPGEAPAAVHAAMLKHFWTGAHTPDLRLLTQDLTATIAAAGGQVVTNARVERIVVVHGRARGVLVGRSGSTRRRFVGVEARTAVVAANGLANMVKLLAEDAPESMRRIAGIVGPSACHVHLFVGLRGPCPGLSAANVWHHGGEDWAEAQRKHLGAVEPFGDDAPPPSPVFISSATAKRGEAGTHLHPTVVLIAEARPEWFATEDRDLKTRVCRRRLLEILYVYYPQTRGRVQVAEVGTPLSSLKCLKYIGARESYGLSMRSGPRFGNAAVAQALRPKTSVPGLFLSGQDVAASGLAGAMAGAALCTHVLGRYGVPSRLGTGLVNAAQRATRA